MRTIARSKIAKGADLKSWGNLPVPPTPSTGPPSADGALRARPSDEDLPAVVRTPYFHVTESRSPGVGLELVVLVEVSARGERVRRRRRPLHLRRRRVDGDASALRVDHAVELSQRSDRIGKEEERHERRDGGEGILLEREPLGRGV